MKKKFLSVMMAVVLLVSNLSGTVLAADAEGEVLTEPAQAVEEVVSENKSEPVAEEPAAEEPVKEEKLEEPVQEAKVEEPAAEEPVVEEEEVEELAAEEPVKEEKTEELAVEEPVKEEVKAIEVTASVEKAAPVTNSAGAEEIPQETEEKVCEEGCILTGEEHEECFVWVDCTLTEGCEGPEGHEGECYGTALYAEEGGTITVSNAKNAYIVVGTDDNSKNDTLYRTNRNGEICDLNGSVVTFKEGTYDIWYGTAGAMVFRNFYKGSVTVNSSSNSVQLNRAINSVASSASAITEDQWNWATCVYYNTSICDHIHIRVAGSYTIDIGGATYNATVSNPSIIVYVNDVKNTEKSWSGTTNYEWTYKTNISLSNEIEVHLKMDLTYRDASGAHTLEDVEVVYNNIKDRNRWIEFIAICDGIQGFDFTVSVQDIQEVIDYYEVIYQWRVYNLDGSVSNDLPESLGAHGLPSPVTGIEAGTEYVYNTGYVEGTSYYDYENGLLYSFHGWDTYSHSSVFNVDPTAAGYEKLDDGDTNASNNKKIPITADTWINGYWTVSKLEPAEAYLMVKKNVVVENGDAEYVKNYLQNISKLFISIDPGIDKDGDDASQVDVDYPAATSKDGYRIDVYQYETPFVFNEYQAEVPGYTRSTVISTSGDNLSLVSEDGATVTGTKAVVDIEEEYDPEEEPYNLGTVIYTNTYTKNTGTAVSEYPTLTILKSAADTGDFQSGVEFTLYSDAECNNPIEDGVYTTDSDGFASVDFEGFSEGTYYLKETKANTGYVLDNTVYAITLKVDEKVEEMHWNDTTNKYEYVEVTYYTLSVNMPEISTAVYTTDENYHRLHVYNSPILGSLTVNKAVTGIDDSSDLLSKLDAVVIVHGPITKDDKGNITDIGNTWQLNLNQEGEFTDSLGELTYGEYLIHESFASVHGYTWDGVTYKEGESNLTPAKYYNNIDSVLFKIDGEDGDEDGEVDVVSISLTNNYSEWAAADFYIKKVDGNGKALAGAEFTLYTDENCTTVADTDQGYTVTATTGADGYAHFNGYTAQEDAITTFYLKETKAPAGYYLSDTVYKVVVSPETDAIARVTTYEAKIYVKNDSGKWVVANFNSDTDLLTVVNDPVLGKLLITKAFEDAPADVKPITVLVNGPDNYSKEVELNDSNDWSTTLENLALGSYTVVEKKVHQPGYTVVAKYQVDENTSSISAIVELKESESGKTPAGTIISGSVAITNTYTQNKEYYEVPTQLIVRKVTEDYRTSLAGAVFKLDRLNAEGNEVISSASFTTNENGEVIFDLLSGFITNNEPVAGTYKLYEEKAPEGYEKTDTIWTVTVEEDGDGLRVELAEDKNVFENFWDWIVSGITGEKFVEWKFDDGVLTVPNIRKVGSLTVVKKVVDEEGYYKDAEYSFTLDCSDDAFDKTFTLKANESYTVENIPWGTTYTLTENTKDAAFVSVIADEGDGVIAEYETRIVVTNTYTYYDYKEYTDDTGSAVLNLLKVDADDNKKVLSGAGFTLYADSELTDPLGEEVFSDEYGKVVIPIEAVGTYYLTETTSPEGYQENDAVYVVTATEEYVIRNAGTSDAFTEILLSITVEGLSEIEDNSYIVENEAEKDEEEKEIVVIKTPKTGDGNNLIGSVIGFMISFIGLCTVFILWFQIRKREDER